MKWISSYLMFNGRCREAMEFYAESLGGTVDLMPYSDEQCRSFGGERIMHARLTQGGAILMASDSTPDKPVQQGNDVWLCVECESMEEIGRMFAALGEGGTVTMPLQDQFWGAHFGMLTDKFGFHWMFNFGLPKA